MRACRRINGYPHSEHYDSVALKALHWFGTEGSPLNGIGNGCPRHHTLLSCLATAFAHYLRTAGSHGCCSGAANGPTWDILVEALLVWPPFMGPHFALLDMLHRLRCCTTSTTQHCTFLYSERFDNTAMLGRLRMWWAVRSFC